MEQIVKKIDNKYIVWFKHSNRWVKLEEPAWFINNLLQKGLNNKLTTKKFADHYNLEIRQCSEFVEEICNKIKEAGKPCKNHNENIIAEDYKENFKFRKFSVRRYLIGGKQFEIKYSTRLSEYYIHRPLAHMEVEDCSNEKVAEKYEIIDNASIKVLRNIGDVSSSWAYKDFMWLKKRLYINITNNIYNKSIHNWLSFVHASAITNGQKTILLSSPSGSGKSTMAALLQIKGFKVVSDDFVPIDAKLKRAYPFPAAISVKKGAFSVLNSFYEILNNKNFDEITKLTVRYIPTVDLSVSDLNARPVKEIIFLRYDPNVECNFLKLSHIKALKLFHNQSWVSRETEHARSFINWFVKLRCFSLTYGDLEKGMDKISELFENRRES
ncbi:MAG: hypothetical protein JW894_02550 [Bacteroidales bacterium]|nr:hypothetical protein [Bacteroidales bacterium]